MTRNSPKADYLHPTVTSFFSRRVDLFPALMVHARQLRDPAGYCLALLDLDQLGGLLKNTAHKNNILGLLSEDETSIFTKFTYPKRQAEWLGGRIAAKTAVTTLMNNPFPANLLSSLSILPNEDGSPRIHTTHGKNASLSISISHSRKYAAALASHATACGLDIQKITAQTKKVLSRFAEQKELSLLTRMLPELNEIQRLSLLWSAKEALKKSLFKDQPVLFQGISLEKIQPGKLLQLSLQHAGSTPDLNIVEAVVLGEYVLAFTLTSEVHARIA